jgi:nucleoside-diphosphate-sugar epimerase
LTLAVVGIQYRAVLDRSDAPTWWIAGCGYVGARLARALLAEGARVVASRRDLDALAGLAAAGAALSPIDLARPDTLAGRCPPGARVVLAAPPVDATGAAEAALIAELARAAAPRLVYVSSTGVYPAAGGAWVDEEVAPAPIGDAGVRRLAAERALAAAGAAAGVEVVALRAAGIYGPGRGVHARLRAGTYRVIGAGDGWVSRIHVDDLVAAIRAAATAAAPPAIVNVADDEPTSSRAHADGVAALLGLPPPPSLDPADASAAARAMLLADRRIANGRLRALLGGGLRHPSWREGTAASLAEEARRV